MPTMVGTTKLELLLRRTAGLNMDKNDLQRLRDFINQKIYDLLLLGKASAKANNRDMIEPWDLPIPKGLQQCLDEGKVLEGELDSKSILVELITVPMLDMEYTIGTEEKLPEVAYALLISLGKVFKTLDEQMKNPQTQHWEHALRIFNAVL